jgi:hypothetical protein
VDAALASMPAEWRRARELRSAIASGAKSITVPLIGHNSLMELYWTVAGMENRHLRSL